MKISTSPEAIMYVLDLKLSLKLSSWSLLIAVVSGNRSCPDKAAGCSDSILPRLVFDRQMMDSEVKRSSVIGSFLLCSCVSACMQQLRLCDHSSVCGDELKPFVNLTALN